VDPEEPTTDWCWRSTCRDMVAKKREEVSRLRGVGGARAGIW